MNVILLMLPVEALGSQSSREISVPELPEFNVADRASVFRAFRRSPQLGFGQSWLDHRERGFQDGRVRLGWASDRLYYLADLQDRDVFTHASKRNQNLWELGDVFEIFASQFQKPDYLEYHTAPNGTILQLVWPNSQALPSIRKTEDINRFKWIDKASTSFVIRRKDGWLVFGWINARSLGYPSGTSLAGQMLQVSFGRYDYGSKGGQPILSSTSPLTKANFHSRAEWTRIRLILRKRPSSHLHKQR